MSVAAHYEKVRERIKKEKEEKTGRQTEIYRYTDR